MTQAESATRHAERGVVVAASLATALVPLNSTMIVVALPEIVDDLDIGIGAAGWLITTYLIAMAVGQPLAGRMGDRVGRRRLLVAGLAGFGLASVGAGVAPFYAALLFFRLLQAVTGAVMMPNAAAMVRAALPADRRASGFGFIGSAAGLSAAVGPLVGAALLATGGWRAVFLANIPLVAAAALAARRVPGDIRVETATSGPIVPDVGILRSRGFRTGAGGTALSNLSMYTLLVAIPLLLDARGWSSSRAALMLAALTIGMAVCSPIGGRLADSMGRRGPAVFGLALMAAAILPLVLEPRDLHGALLVCVMALTGIGLGLANASLQTVALESVAPARAGTAAGLHSTLRYAGSFVGTAMLTLLLSGADRYGAVFAMAFTAAALAALVATRVPDRPRSAEVAVTTPR